MSIFVTSKNKYLSNDMKIVGTCSIPLSSNLYAFIILVYLISDWCGDMGHSPIQLKNGPLTTEIVILNLERMASLDFPFSL